MNRVHICRACLNIRNGIKTKIAVPHTCGKTDDELREDMRRRELQAMKLRNLLSALATIKRLKENHGKIECPVCGGDLHYTRASNGHTWGKCKTEGCLSWME